MRNHHPVAARALLLVAALALLVGVTGCGTDDDATAARGVVDAFFAALEGDDGEKACEQLNPETRAALEDQEKSACRDAITQLDLQASDVERVQVYGRSAMAELSDGEAAFLDQEQSGWRISAAGCRPVGDRPYDCELED